MRVVLIFSACIIFTSACTQVTGGSKKESALVHKDLLLYNTFKDTCIVSFYTNSRDTIYFHRRYKVLENTFTDTMNIAGDWVPPGNTGEKFCAQVDTFWNRLMDYSDEYQSYLEENDLPQLYTRFLCMGHLSGKVKTPAVARQKAGEYMRIRIWYKANASK